MGLINRGGGACEVCPSAYPIRAWPRGGRAATARPAGHRQLVFLASLLLAAQLSKLNHAAHLPNNLFSVHMSGLVSYAGELNWIPGRGGDEGTHANAPSPAYVIPAAPLLSMRGHVCLACLLPSCSKHCTGAPEDAGRTPSPWRTWKAYYIIATRYVSLYGWW